MERSRRVRESVLTALLIAPDRELANQFSATLGETRAFQILADLKAYPARNTLDIRLRQFKPDVVLMDVASDLETAGDLIRFIAGCRPPIQVVGLHHHNDSTAIVRVLRLGASEFLYAPFDPCVQREAIARIRRLHQPESTAEPEQGKVIVFTSAKPGSGSSTLATHTAHAIRKATGKRVLIADLDLQGGTVGFYLKLQPAYSIVDVLQHSERLDATLWSAATVHSSGIDVLAAPDHPYCEGVDSTRLHEVLEYARLLYDWVVIDAPSVFHRVSLLTVSESDQTFLVSTGDLASLHLARKAVNLLTQLGFGKDRYQMVVNRLSKRDGIAGSDIGKIFNCSVHASIPNDYFALHRVISLGQPLSPDCDLGKAIASLAARVSGAIALDKRAASTASEPKPALSES
jgi:pilus assembly protein CpaE